MSRRNTTVALLVLCLISVGGLLYADGAFSSSWTVRLDGSARSRHISEFGPPTRLDMKSDASGGMHRVVVAEPIYTDVRIPSFFDVIEVEAQITPVEYNFGEGQIGFELGRESARYALAATEVDHQSNIDGVLLKARMSLVGVPQEDNRFRLVLSLPGVGVDSDKQVLLERFTVTARHSGNWKHMLSRFFHF